MKLNKVLMIAVIGAAFVSFNDTFTALPRPEKVQAVLDEQGNEVAGMLNVKDKNTKTWVRFEKNMNACMQTEAKKTEPKKSKKTPKKSAPMYEYTSKERTALNVKEADGSCTLYVKARELTPDEKSTIMMEEVIKD